MAVRITTIDGTKYDVDDVTLDDLAAKLADPAAVLDLSTKSDGDGWAPRRRLIRVAAIAAADDF